MEQEEIGADCDAPASEAAAPRLSLEQLIVARYQPPGWLAFYELQSKPGWDRGRIDVAVVGAWESNRAYRVACEVKRSRSDFMRDLDKPQKQRWVEEKFHETYYVCEPGIAKEHELPDGWGLYVPTSKGDKLRRLRVAKRRDVGPLDEGLAVMFLRHAQELLVKHRGPDLVCLDGKTLTRAQVEEYVQNRLYEAMTLERGRLENGRNEVAQERRVLAQERHDLQAPLTELRILASSRRGWSRSPQPGITVEMVQRWYAEARSNLIRELLEPFQKVRDVADHFLAEGRRAEAQINGETETVAGVEAGTGTRPATVSEIHKERGL